MLCRNWTLPSSDTATPKCTGGNGVPGDDGAEKVDELADAVEGELDGVALCVPLSRRPQAWHDKV
eukprot:scaffold6036_cov371-Prasinococcus_capsulatus_cf.AAC.14